MGLGPSTTQRADSVASVTQRSKATGKLISVWYYDSLDEAKRVVSDGREFQKEYSWKLEKTGHWYSR